MTNNSPNLKETVKEFKGLLKINNAFLFILIFTLFVPLVFLKDAPTPQENIWRTYLPPLVILIVCLLGLIKLKLFKIKNDFGCNENWANSSLINKQITIIVVSSLSPIASVILWFNRETFWDVLVTTWQIVPVLVFANFWLVITMAIKNRIRINKDITVSNDEELK